MFIVKGILDFYVTTQNSWGLSQASSISMIFSYFNCCNMWKVIPPTTNYWIRLYTQPYKSTLSSRTFTSHLSPALSPPRTHEKLNLISGLRFSMSLPLLPCFKINFIATVCKQHQANSNAFHLLEIILEKKSHQSNTRITNNHQAQVQTDQTIWCFPCQKHNSAMLQLNSHK